jgi:hypothetical protein
MSLQGRLTFGDPIGCFLEASAGTIPGKVIFLSFTGNEFYNANALIVLVRSICVIELVASE